VGWRFRRRATRIPFMGQINAMVCFPASIRSAFRPLVFSMWLLAAVLVGLACSIPDTGRTFHVDSTGDDGADGLSPRTAWRSLERVNSHVFQPGDRLLFRRGDRFEGQLRPQGSGEPGRPVVVDVYGGGGRPLIEAEGRFNEALLLRNQEYWEINGLELTNTGPTREEHRAGVRVAAWDFGTMRHIHLKDLHVRDVNGSLVKRDPGEGHGIVWENGGDQVESRFDGLLIEGCRLERTDRNGICGYSPYPTDRSVWYPSLNVVIRGNHLEDIGGDGIKVWGCEDALVEHNVVRNGRQRCDDYAAGIWPWNSDRTLIQFNEVSGMKGQKDGQAFDSDGFCHGTVFQYNYSHDNEGGFMLICGRENTGTVIRYNISQDDQTRLFHFYDRIDGTRIYNNVFYVGPEIDLHLFLWTPGRSGWANDTLVANNIFYIDGVGRNSRGLRKKAVDDGRWISEPGFGGAEGVRFHNNILYGRFEDLPEDWLAMSRDPMLEAPGSARDGFESLSGYRLRPGSPAVAAGAPIEDSGGRDFWGNPLPSEGNPSIGVHETRGDGGAEVGAPATLGP
jgi:hypothetical protein